MLRHRMSQVAIIALFHIVSYIAVAIAIIISPYCQIISAEMAPAGGGGRGAAGLVEPAAAVETPLAAPPPPRGGRW